MFFVPGFALGSFQSVELLQVSAGCPIWSGLVNSSLFFGDNVRKHSVLFKVEFKVIQAYSEVWARTNIWFSSSQLLAKHSWTAEIYFHVQVQPQAFKCSILSRWKGLMSLVVLWE